MAKIANLDAGGHFDFIRISRGTPKNTQVDDYLKNGWMVHYRMELPPSCDHQLTIGIRYERGLFRSISWDASEFFVHKKRKPKVH